MKNKNIKSILVSIIACTIIIAAGFNDKHVDKNLHEKYSLVKVFVNSAEEMQLLQSSDISLDHYAGKPSEGIELTLNQEELARLRNTGLRYVTEVQDLDLYYSQRETPSSSDMQRSYNILEKDNVTGFSFGSMGGFYTFNEVVQKLDSMRLVYPNLISVKRNIGTSTEGKTIWAVKLSDNPDIDESSTEPAIYFDALHHAREPESMACLMYYMYWLLENYSQNTTAEYLLNNREIFFVPVVNPDGYVYNQTTNPNGGGSWRKNRRNNGGSYGVDLNRNYDYGWGLNSGSSGTPSSETYRGPSAGSEPETQAIKSFTQQIHPKISFSMHSYAGRYLNPYGYNDTAIRYDVYSEYSSDFAASNNYTYGTVNEMLDYYSSGTTRDFLHSTGTYCWTPEVGGSGFWPLQSEIIPVASENLYGLKYLSMVGGGYADMLNYKISGKGYVNRNDSLPLQIKIKNRGLSQPVTGVNVNVTALYPNVLPTTLTYSFNSTPINPGQTADITSFFNFRTTSSSVYMDEMKYVVKVSQQGVVTSEDTIRITIGAPTVLFTDNAENGISKWTRAGTGILWDSTYIDPYDGSKNFADSRYGNSTNSSNNTFTINDTINLIGAVNPRIEFTAKWATEATFDYVRIQVTTNYGTSWINLPGRYTTTVSGQPSYTAIKSWVNEQIVLNPYIGQKIKIRFNYITDAGVPGDGFYFDNFRVINYRDTATFVASNSAQLPEEYRLYQNYPNPFNPVTHLEFGIKEQGFVSLKVFDALGKETAVLVNENLSPGVYNAIFNGGNYPSGVYYYKLEASNGQGVVFSSVKKMILLK